MCCAGELQYNIFQHTAYSHMRDVSDSFPSGVAIFVRRMGASHANKLQVD